MNSIYLLSEISKLCLFFNIAKFVTFVTLLWISKVSTKMYILLPSARGPHKIRIIIIMHVMWRMLCAMLQ